MYVYMYICALHACLVTTDLNPGPLQEQQGLLATEPSLQPLQRNWRRISKQNYTKSMCFVAIQEGLVGKGACYQAALSSVSEASIAEEKTDSHGLPFDLQKCTAALTHRYTVRE